MLAKSIAVLTKTLGGNDYACAHFKDALTEPAHSWEAEVPGFTPLSVCLQPCRTRLETVESPRGHSTAPGDISNGHNWRALLLACIM